jgi:hypothetical protein
VALRALRGCFPGVSPAAARDFRIRRALDQENPAALALFLENGAMELGRGVGGPMTSD